MTQLAAWAARWNIPTLALAELRALAVPGVVSSRQPAASETRVSAEIRIGAATIGTMLLRNNSGMAYNPNGQPVRFGLGNDSKKINEVFKSSDLIGFTHEGRFVALESKATGWKYKGNDHEVGQRNFLDAVVRHNGIGAFVTSWEEARRAIGG